MSHVLQSNQPPVDFVIITALEEERDAVLSKLPDQRKLDRDGAGAHTYYEARVRTRRQDGSVYRVIVTSLSGVGPTKGAIKAGAVIKRWSPAHVLMVGIAGGVVGEVTPGDVMVASQVADYTLGKIHGSGRREERWVAYPADADLFDAALNFPTGWEDLIAHSPPEPGAPRRYSGVVASGGDVIASKKQIAVYRADWPKLIGVEMEGGGVAAGLHDDIERPRFLMIRGVSDLANGENNAEVKAAWRAYACHVAAAYAIGFLRDGPVRAAADPTAHAAVPASPAPVQALSVSPVPDRGALMDGMHRLSESQLNEVVLRLRVPEEHLASRSAPLATRVVDLIRLMEQGGDHGIRRLVDEVRAVTLDLQGSTSQAPAPDLRGSKPSVQQAVPPHADSAPTWDEFNAAPRRYEVNQFDDIVLVMHPDCVREWRDVVPNAHAASLRCEVIRTADGPWNRQTLPDPVVWNDVIQQIEGKVQEVLSAKRPRIHLMALAPYSLGLLLGARLDPQNGKLIVYQQDNKPSGKEKVWRPWGPEWPADPGVRTAPFFDIPPGLDRRRPEQEGEIAVIVDVTGRQHTESCVAAVQAFAPGRPVQSIVIRPRLAAEQGAVQKPADVDKASGELVRLFQDVAEALPNMRMHLFYYGPNGILIRASRGLPLLRTRIIVWEAVYPGGQAQWVPVLELPAGRLLVGDGGEAAEGAG